MADFALLEPPKLISSKFWVKEKSWYFHTVWYSAQSLNMSWQNIYHLDFSESASKQKTFGGVGLSQNRITISNLVISKKHNHLWMPFCAILFFFVLYNRILPYYTNCRPLNWSKFNFSLCENWSKLNFSFSKKI